MDYNFYSRKAESITQKQIDWIDENIESISQEESILFVFQGDYEALFFTDSNLYFPNRTTNRRINYSQIKKIERAGNTLLELYTVDSEVYSIVLVTPVDKVKIFQVLQLLVENCIEGIKTTFEDTHQIFNEFTVLKHPPKQSQHKLPQVYLKQFGYLNGDQWKVSILRKGERFTRQKSIGNFTSETNVFDIESEDDRFPRIFESLNTDLENFYNEMLKDISDNAVVPDKCWAIITQLTPNLMVRSDYWRSFVNDILNSPNKVAFLDVTLSVHVNSNQELRELKTKDFYKIVSEGEITQTKLNKILIHFLNYIFQYLKTFNLVIIEAPEDKQFLTSDNPVTFKPNQLEGKIGLFSNDTEVFLPLSKKYLAYFSNQNSEKLTSLRRLKNKGIYKATDVFSEDEYELMVNEEIISKSDQLIIFPGKTDYRLDE